MDVDGIRSWIQVDQILLHLTDTSYGALQCFLDEVALLRVDDLIITFFQFAVYIYVFDVQNT